MVTRLLLGCSDLEVLTCCSWVLAFLGSNEENKTHIKQVRQTLSPVPPKCQDASSRSEAWRDIL